MRPRWWPSLDRILARRRSVRRLGTRQPSRKQLSRLLQISHGITGSYWAGPVPSAGGLQALELYLVPLEPGWLAQGAYHYDRQEHSLARVVAEAPRPRWADLVPSLGLVEGGALLWVLVGDVGRVRRKYGERSLRFLLQESGHLMQTLCLASASLGLATVPMGGYLERPSPGSWSCRRPTWCSTPASPAGLSRHHAPRVMLRLSAAIGSWESNARSARALRVVVHEDHRLTR